MKDEKFDGERMDDETMVSEAYERLVQTYLKSPHRRKTDLIERAFNFAKQAHKGVRRLSGEPYIMHPIAVAQIACGEIGLGSTSICAALLHDVVEDTDYTVEDISNLFGPKIAQIVDGVTKISGGIFGEQASSQAESFKKLLITMSDDIRVILVKISDRLHNMRTLGSQRKSKQFKIAGETLYLYAPLAHRLGLNKIKEELEDLSFGYEHPDTRQEIIDKLAGTQAERDHVFSEFTAPIRAALDGMGVGYEIKARIKTPYSIFTKMQTKNVEFEKVYDILAVRIIFTPNRQEDEVSDCFRIYGKITEIYNPHPERFRNWLSHPKTNGYQALHGTFMSHFGQWIEVQIRSNRMDDMAEQGFAAHWKYKEGANSPNESETELEHWLSTIKEILDDPQPNAMDFLDTIKLGLYASEIFVVTPKGEFKTMPAECTVLDFAFSLHTFLGSHCIGANVNHTLVPISHKLHSGDQVQILTSNKATIQKEWMEWVYTAKAKSKIEAALRKARREKAQKGERMLNEFLRAADIETNSATLDRLCELHGIKVREQLLAAIGEGEVSLGENDRNILRGKKQKGTGWRRYIPFLHTDVKTGEVTIANPLEVDKKKTFQLNDDMLGHVTICKECTPLPGDPVLGYVAKSGSITIHKRHCPDASRLKASDGNSLIAVDWDIRGHHHFPATLNIRGIDRMGGLAAICTRLSEIDVNIRSLRTETKDGIFNIVADLDVHGVKHVRQICDELRKLEGIQGVQRTS